MAPAGVISWVAGISTPGNGGDNGPATDAQLNSPLGVVVTADGGFLIADTGNHEVRGGTRGRDLSGGGDRHPG